jgi:hypothetical protein
MRQVRVGIAQDGKTLTITIVECETKPPFVAQIENIDQLMIFDRRANSGILSGASPFSAPRTRHPQ